MKELSRILGLVALLLPVALLGCGGEEPAPGVGGAEEAAPDTGGGAEEMFPDYRPKLGPDTIADYRQAQGMAPAALPEASLASLPELLVALEKAWARAKAEPGKWEEGNVALGAEPKEYAPSEAELDVVELGERIRAVLDGLEAGAVKGALAVAGVGTTEVEVLDVEIRHVDVMGSGRFFYATEPKPATIILTGE
jgi:hypothetical protein